MNGTSKVPAIEPMMYRGDTIVATEVAESLKAALSDSAFDAQQGMSFVRFVNEPEGEIDAYLAIWGSPENRDAYGTWFDKDNPPDLGLKDGKFLPVRIMYEHGQDDTLQREIIGEIRRVWMDNVGIRFQGLLDKTAECFTRVVDEIRKGLLKVSSASAEHLAEFDADGRFVDWYLSEVSLTQDPAEPNMRRVALVRSTTGIQLTQSVSVDNADSAGGDPIGSTANTTGDGESEAAASIDVSQNKTVETKVSKRTMLTLEQLGLQTGAGIDEVFAKLKELVGENAAKAMLNDMLGSGADTTTPPEGDMPEMMSNDAGQRSKAKKPAAVTTTSDDSEIVTLRAKIEALENKMKTEGAEVTTTTRSNSETQISVGDEVKYFGKSHKDLEFAYLVMRSRGIAPSKDFMRNLSGKVADAIEKGDKSLNNPVVRSALRGATRSNEIAISTASGGGDEWVTLDYADTIWAASRNDLIMDQIVARGVMVKEVKPGAESVTFPTEGADPTVYTIAQNGSLTSNRPAANIGVTRIGTGQVVCTPGELGAAVAWSDVFDEDSIINVSSQYSYQTTTALKETVDKLFINADSATGASTNINLIDGTPGTGLSTPYYIATNGALKYALVTGSSTSRDGGTLDENDYRLTLKLMTAPTRTKLKQLLYIIDADTHSASLDIPAIKTEDVKRTNATITSGVMTNIWGIDVFQTGLMPLANNVGKVPAAGGTLGRILCVYAPYWGMAWKRQITIETDRDILSGDNILVAKMRVGFAARGADAATVTYNLTV